jgi:DHA1 family tetracycline resistance protein-like MFS transporter
MKRSALIILFITLFIDLLGFGLVLPLIPVYIRHYGGQPWVGGALMASFSVMQFIFSPIWGRISDRHGRRPMILLSLIGSGISFMAFGAAPNLIALFAARVAAGILSSASLPTAQAYIADVTPPDKRARGMAVIGVAFGLGFALGPVVGGVLSAHPILGIPALAMPAYFAAILCILNFIWAIFALPETHFDRTETSESRGPLDAFKAMAAALRNPDVSAELLVFTFGTFAFAAVESTFSWLVLLRFNDVIQHNAQAAWHAAHPAVAWAVASATEQQHFIDAASTATTLTIFKIVGVTILLVQGAVMGGAAGKLNERSMVQFGSLLLTATLVGIALAPTLPIVWIFSALIAVGSGVMNPPLSSLITKAAGPQQRGLLSGAQQGLASAARIISPPINNSLVMVNTSIPFLSSAFLMGIAFFLSLRLREHAGDEEATAVSAVH